MLFYDSMGPNPKVVRMFMAERGISGIPTETIDLRGGENRKDPFLARNPSGQCPALVLDNGAVISEITASCEYLDETGPAGHDPDRQDGGGKSGDPHVVPPH